MISSGQEIKEALQKVNEDTRTLELYYNMLTIYVHDVIVHKEKTEKLMRELIEMQKGFRKLKTNNQGIKKLLIRSES